jgi:hypothetical protein
MHRYAAWRRTEWYLSHAQPSNVFMHPPSNPRTAGEGIVLGHGVCDDLVATRTAIFLVSEVTLVRTH